MNGTTGAAKRMRTRVVGAALLLAAIAGPARAADPLLDETVEFAGTIAFLQHKTPAFIVGVTRDGERAVFGFGETADGSGVPPDGKTLLRIGSVTKVFTGGVLASLAADGTAALTDPLEKHLGWDVKPPERAGRAMRLIDLATHAGGFPRDVPHAGGPANDPFSTLTEEAFKKALETGGLLFAPGTGALYSNMGFDLLATALAAAAGKPYDALLAERLTGPLGLSDTSFAPGAEQKTRMMQGHGFDGAALPDVPTVPFNMGSGGLYSTTEDILTWLEWQLDRSGTEDAETRALSQAPWLQRDGLSPAFGLDESGFADAVALGWIVMMPEGDRPLILQKAGGLQGIFCYAAFAPTRGIGAFAAVNAFDIDAGIGLAQMVNELIANLAAQ